MGTMDSFDLGLADNIKQVLQRPTDYPRPRVLVVDDEASIRDLNGQRYREPLGTTDWREARDVEKRRIAELAKRPPDPAKRRRTLGSLDVQSAIDAYVEERRSQVSPRMVAYWKENAGP